MNLAPYTHEPIAGTSIPMSQIRIDGEDAWIETGTPREVESKIARLNEAHKRGWDTAIEAAKTRTAKAKKS